MKKWLSNIYFSFPIQLAVLHLRSQMIFIGLWITLGLFITGVLGDRFGFPSLFLDPEYLGRVGFTSFFLVGASYAQFFMSWNLATYLLTAHHFPFLASLSRPFTKFCINNFIIPVGFFLFYVAEISYFQTTYGELSAADIMLYTLGLMSGILSSLLLYGLYFRLTNRDISYYEKRQHRLPHLFEGMTPGRRNVDIDYIKQPDHSERVQIYLNEFMRPKIVRSVAHYKSDLIKRIFRQNHLNALISQLLTVFGLILLGLLIDFPASRIPAGASIFIMLSIFIAFIGAITYWFSEWSIPVVIGLFFLINYLTGFDLLHRDNLVYGLNYQEKPVEYNSTVLEEICNTELIDQDIKATQKILENWKQRNDSGDGQKPKLTLLCVSGGGLKAATWAFRNIQLADSLTNGKLLQSNVLITGASGGMIGAAYLRELYLRKQQGDSINLYDKQYLRNISKDLLNSISFTWVTNDLFLPFAKFKIGNQTYYKDRGYIFERQLNENTHFILDKTLGDYRQAEAEAIIPMMYITPTIINDARRLIISPQGASFMMISPVGLQLYGEVQLDAVDYRWLFQNHNPDDLHFTSALRMNATYPYVLPNPHLPSGPVIETMDAGIRDNFGILSATRFLQVYKDWILENTSGVVLVQITSTEEIESILPDRDQGSIEKLMKPLGLTGLLFTIQSFEQDNNIGFIIDLLGKQNFDLVRFYYDTIDEEVPRAPVSFHLTSRDKRNVLDAVWSEENQKTMKRLQELLGE
jgi:hypothetical protein